MARPNLPEFTERLYKAIQRAEISQATLARSLGVSKNTVTSWTRGSSIPGLDYAAALARALEVSLDDLVGATPEPGHLRLRAELADPRFVAGLNLLAREVDRAAGE